MHYNNTFLLSLIVLLDYMYVEELFQFYLGLKAEQLQEARQTLKDMEPEPMNSMLDKQPREEAIRKRAERLSMVAKDVLPTAPPGIPYSTYMLCPTSYLYAGACA